MARQISYESVAANHNLWARAATTAALAANTYANGSSGGIGATLTANSNGALTTQDGVTLVANDYLLVKNEASQAHNGLYVVQQVGDASNPYILRRHLGLDTDAKINLASVFVGHEGGTNGTTLWLMNYVSSPTMGTSNLVFSKI